MQKAAVERLVEIGGRSVSRAMMTSKIPYSIQTAHNPKKLTDRKGFKELYEQYGLTKGFITKALVADIKAKKKNRLGELRLGAEILKLTEKGKEGDTFNTIIFTDEQSAQIARRRLAGDRPSEKTPN